MLRGRGCKGNIQFQGNEVLLQLAFKFGERCHPLVKRHQFLEAVSLIQHQISNKCAAVAPSGSIAGRDTSTVLCMLNGRFRSGQASLDGKLGIVTHVLLGARSGL